MTDKPFGVNLTFLPSVTPPDYPGLVRAIVDSGVKVVETAGNNPQEWLPQLKDAGIKVIHNCTSVRHSLKAQSIGCDAISVDGFECGGHPGEDDVPNFILLPRAADELEIPFVASGGIGGCPIAGGVACDGRGRHEPWALASSQLRKRRFTRTSSKPWSAASELDTRLIMRPLRNTERVLTNPAVERLVEKEKALGTELKFEDIMSEVAGVYPRVMTDGEMDAGAWSCGMVAGLIYDYPDGQGARRPDHGRGRGDHREPAGRA